MESEIREEIKPQRKSRRRTIIIVVVLLLVIAIVVFVLVRERTITVLDKNNLPKIIQADFIDLSRIFSISKFRSGSGHDFSEGTDETCRSMKHYFNVQWTEEGQRQWRKNNEMPPAPDGKNDILIFSPVDGKITSIQSEQKPIGQQIYIRPSNYPGYTIRLFHIYKSDGIKVGSTIKAGQQIGVIGQYQNTDIVVEAKSWFKTNFVSYFEVMPDSIFEKYRERGVKDRNELIISREYRDAHPLECNGERFAQDYDRIAADENFTYLSGYIDDSKNQPATNDTTSGSQTAPASANQSVSSSNIQTSNGQSNNTTNQQNNTSSSSQTIPTVAKLSYNSIVTPYLAESDISSVNEAYSLVDSNPYWGFRHPGIDFMTASDLVSVQASVAGTIENVTIEKSEGIMGWHAGFCINPGGENSVCYNLETFGSTDDIGNRQKENFFVKNGDTVKQGDIIAKLVHGSDGAHIDFGVTAPDTRVCPEPYFTIVAKESVLRLIHKNQPTWPICYEP